MKVRKSVMLLCNICLILFFSFSNAFSESIRISRIDSNSLLLNQKIKVYLSVTDENGKPVKDLGIDNFEIFESPENHTGQEREILAFEKGVNINRGIHLLLVLDNSGSMYWDGSGKIKNSTDQEIWRITYAKEAITSLLKEIKNPLDRVGLFTFNVKIDTETALTNDRVKIVKAIIEIKKPSEEEAYTELYETLYQAVNYLRVSKGRKIIIVLSDGQNFPLDKNPHFPERYGIEGAIDSAQKEGISVFTIGLSKKADRKNLRRIAEETGGAYFSVYDPGRLEDLYNMIRDQILNEYLVTYSAGMEPAEKKLVKVSFRDEGMQGETERFYYSGTIFGFPPERIDYLIFLIIPVSAGLLWLLSMIKFEKKKVVPSLNVRTSTGRKTVVHTIPVTEKSSAITIGAGASTDITIAGDPKIAKTEAKIINKNGVYTITSTASPITVNNKPVKTKVLRSGDLIQLGDTGVVFDMGVTDQIGKR